MSDKQETIGSNPIEATKIHLYFREKETGRFITHFIIEDDIWEVIVMAAKEANISEEEFILEAIKAAITI